MTNMGLVELVKYQYGEFSARNAGIKERLVYAVMGMQGLYKELKFDDDPIIREAIARGSAGARQGHITDTGLLGAIGHYSDKYKKAYIESTIQDILDSIERTGYDIPENAKNALEKYRDMKYSDLVEKARSEKENDEDAKKAIQALSMLEEVKFEAQLAGSMIRESITGSLNELYKEEREE